MLAKTGLALTGDWEAYSDVEASLLSIKEEPWTCSGIWN